MDKKMFKKSEIAEQLNFPKLRTISRYCSEELTKDKILLAPFKKMDEKRV